MTSEVATWKGLLSAFGKASELSFTTVVAHVGQMKIAMDGNSGKRKWRFSD